MSDWTEPLDQLPLLPTLDLFEHLKQLPTQEFEISPEKPVKLKRSPSEDQESPEKEPQTEQEASQLEEEEEKEEIPS